ncbi:response regulator, partial [Pseudomonas sp.]|uniref:response regulator n=1 Tax=Pseudomonas sp. TaxID=306 RepID=UPI003A96908F
MNATLPHTLILVDDHPMMRRGLRQLIELEGDLTVVGEANNGFEACTLLERLNPDLVVLDNNMPQLNGVETLKRLREQGFAGKILLFTVSDAEHDVRDAMRFGADGYLLKDMEPEHLIARLREVLRGNLVISPSLTTVLAQALRTPQGASSLDLTERERQVL